MTPGSPVPESRGVRPAAETCGSAAIAASCWNARATRLTYASGSSSGVVTPPICSRRRRNPAHRRRLSSGQVFAQVRRRQPLAERAKTARSAAAGQLFEAWQPNRCSRRQLVPGSFAGRQETERDGPARMSEWGQVLVGCERACSRGIGAMVDSEPLRSALQPACGFHECFREWRASCGCGARELLHVGRDEAIRRRRAGDVSAFGAIVVDENQRDFEVAGCSECLGQPARHQLCDGALNRRPGSAQVVQEVPGIEDEWIGEWRSIPRDLARGCVGPGRSVRRSRTSCQASHRAARGPRGIRRRPRFRVAAQPSCHRRQPHSIGLRARQ